MKELQHHLVVFLLTVLIWCSPCALCLHVSPVLLMERIWDANGRKLYMYDYFVVVEAIRVETLWQIRSSRCVFTTHWADLVERKCLKSSNLCAWSGMKILNRSTLSQIYFLWKRIDLWGEKTIKSCFPWDLTQGGAGCQTCWFLWKKSQLCCHFWCSMFIPIVFDILKMPVKMLLD